LAKRLLLWQAAHKSSLTLANNHASCDRQCLCLNHHLVKLNDLLLWNELKHEDALNG